MLAEHFLRISEAEVSFERRGFRDDRNGVREPLERAGGAFVQGYNAALRHAAVVELAYALDALPRDLHGFAYEGASMALGILDLLTPWKRTRWTSLLARAPQHVYLCFVGVGWSLARLRMRKIPPFVRRANVLLAPLAADGYGFHEAFFKPDKIVRAAAPSPLAGLDAHEFDQGVGRALWFVDGGNPQRIAATIGTFAPQRQSDLWSGTGLALAYAGGVDERAAAELIERSGQYRQNVAQGIAFAAKARALAGNITPATELVCSLAWRRNAIETAAVVDEALARAEGAAANVHYETWRRMVSCSL
jgi:enediyne biosynthesis protein E3